MNWGGGGGGVVLVKPDQKAFWKKKKTQSLEGRDHRGINRKPQVKKRGRTLMDSTPEINSLNNSHTRYDSEKKRRLDAGAHRRGARGAVERKT